MENKNRTCLGIIREAIKQGIPVGTLCQKKGLKKDYVRWYIRQVKEKKNKIEDDIELLEAYEEYSNWYQNKFFKEGSTNNKQKNNSSFNKNNNNSNFDNGSIDSEKLTAEEILEQSYDPYLDDKYEDRSIGEALREDKTDFVIDPGTGKPVKLPNGKPLIKITRYHYKVFIRNQDPLEGYFDRNEMLLVYRLYSGLEGNSLTVRAVSRHFPDLTYRDFKRILRAFNITKQSTPIAIHILEENSEDKIVEIIFRNKENSVLKKLETERSKNAERMLEQVMKELVEVKKNKSDLKEIFSGIQLPETKPFKIAKKAVKEERALSVYLSDQHVGCKNDETALYGNHYDEHVFAERMEKVLNHIQKTYSIYGRFDKILINNLGDSGDGVGGQTARKGHYLPQNLNDRKQFTVYVETMVKFFDTLYKMDVANSIMFNSVGESNHYGSNMEFIVNQTLKYIFEVKYPGMEINVFEKFIEHIEYGRHTLILNHGKDASDLKFGFPLTVNDKTKLYFDEYITQKKIDRNSVISVVKGDLHQSATTFAKTFRYRSVSSMLGTSSWIHKNYGVNPPGVDYEILDKNAKDFTGIMEGRIYF